MLEVKTYSDESLIGVGNEGRNSQLMRAAIHLEHKDSTTSDVRNEQSLLNGS